MLPPIIIHIHMDSARVFPCMVCHRPHFILRLDKKKMLLKYLDGNIDIIAHISEYDCLRHASTAHNYMTTRLQYSSQISSGYSFHNNQIGHQTFCALSFIPTSLYVWPPHLQTEVPILHILMQRNNSQFISSR